MRKFLLSLVFAITAIAMQAQEPAVIMTTNKSINSQFSFGISANAANTPIQIDWGNGVKEDFTIGDVTEFFSYPLEGNTVKIWGTGIASLNIDSKLLTALDVTHATSLTYLYCKTNLLTALDLSNCTALKFVDCSDNLLSSLILPSTSTLVAVNCDNNLLSSLNVSGTPAITELTCTNNKLSFATLPLKQPTWTTYTYNPQQNISLPKQTYSTNEEIDLSSQLTVGSNTTTYIWKTASGTTLVNGTDYNATGGKFNFLKTFTENLYCEMTNSTFPSLILKSLNITVLPSPSVIITTTKAVGESFQIEISANVTNTKIFVDWGNGSISNYSVGPVNSTLNSTLYGNTVKVYGTGITKLNVTYNKITSLNVKECNTLRELYCYNNNIGSLDVSGLISLEILQCYSNEMVNLDVTNCNSLSTLFCYYNKLSTLSTNNCNSLKLLYCTGNNISALDVSMNLNLEELGCSNNTLTSIDLTQNINLKLLGCSDNQLSSIDLSKNTLLSRLHLANNQLSSINLNNNPLINRLDIPGNWLTFSKLPFKTATLVDYIYSPQRKINLPKSEYSLIEEIDLSSHLTAGGNTTVYTWKTIGGVTLVKNVDYTESNGKFAFIKQPSNYFFCEMRNATFPNLTLTTNNILIPVASPAITMVTSNTIGNNIEFSISTSNSGTPVLIDWGNGAVSYYSVGTVNSTLNGKLYGNTVKVYGTGITRLNVSDNKITSLNVKECKTLRELYCDKNNIGSLDVSGLISLEILHCFSNDMVSLNVTNCNSLSSLFCYYNKLSSLSTNNCNSLRLLYCTGNNISALDVSMNLNLEELGCSNNALTSIDLTQNTNLKLLAFSDNKLSTINLSKNTLLSRLHLANNQLSSINLTNNPQINRLDISGNWLSFSKLPIKTSTLIDYIYSPQIIIKLPQKQYGLTETVNLSSELTIDGKTTSYIWKTKGGATLVAGTDYNVNNGVTTFLKIQSDSVYCQMTNATFPDLTLSTTNIKVSQFPLSVTQNEVAVKVYPNPASDNFSVEMTDEIVKVEVYTITGVKVFENSLYSSTKVSVPLTNMPKGTLIVRSFTRNGVYESKVIKI